MELLNVVCRAHFLGGARAKAICAFALFFEGYNCEDSIEEPVINWICHIACVNRCISLSGNV